MSIEKNTSNKQSGWIDINIIFADVDREIEEHEIRSVHLTYNPTISDEEVEPPLTVNPLIEIDPNINISPHWLRRRNEP